MASLIDGPTWKDYKVYCGDGPRNFKPKSSDEDDTRNGPPLSHIVAKCDIKKINRVAKESLSTTARTSDQNSTKGIIKKYGLTNSCIFRNGLEIELWPIFESPLATTAYPSICRYRFDPNTSTLSITPRRSSSRDV
ncbi:hypothetical protein TNCV_276961 [Trichonephila clavipes]|uniref:Uncharacterized protein n=1 Tax=Trichonephila clavipes TaxID=2585209 RepID=A0A8X6VH46_TRICX|nr:hypothetical protein TNCV_276961 [Trichonephila clavipes]